MVPRLVIAPDLLEQLHRLAPLRGRAIGLDGGVVVVGLLVGLGGAQQVARVGVALGGASVVARLLEERGRVLALLALGRELGCHREVAGRLVEAGRLVVLAALLVILGAQTVGQLRLSLAVEDAARGLQVADQVGLHGLGAAGEERLLGVAESEREVLALEPADHDLLLEDAVVYADHDAVVAIVDEEDRGVVLHVANGVGPGRAPPPGPAPPPAPLRG